MKINKETLFDVVVEILVALGENPENAKIVGENFCFADSRGITTHGSYLLTPIYNRVKVEQLTLPTEPKTVIDEGAISVIDGGDGLGPVAGQKAVDIAVDKASMFGISQVLIRNTNNLGSLAFYTEKIARQGMIGVMSCNAAPAMAPWGGAEPFTGTNPIAIAIFTGSDLLFSADMATSVVARGKIRKAARENKSIPEGWAIDADGNPTTDPNTALMGTVLPMGGAKGSAIALVIDIVSGILAGAEHAPNIKSFHSPQGKTGVGATLIAVDIKKFIAVDKFTSIMEDYIHNLKSMKKAEFAPEIFLPGEIEQNRERESDKSGITLTDAAVDVINQYLEELGSEKRLESKA